VLLPDDLYWRRAGRRAVNLIAPFIFKVYWELVGVTVLSVSAFSLYALTGGKTSGVVFEQAISIFPCGRMISATCFKSLSKGISTLNYERA
jgi:hypothetical protein